MAGPSPHLCWTELACYNRLGRMWQAHPAGAVIAPYPAAWRLDRAVGLATTFERIRAALGHFPIHINSAYRTVGYNRAVGGAGESQHTLGQALDLQHSALPADRFHQAILELYHGGQLPQLGGLGRYPTFVHIDIRPRVAGRLAQW